MADTKTTIEKLSGVDNYGTWKFVTKMLLIHEDLWDAVEQKKEKDDKIQKKALARICLLVQPCVYPHIRGAETAHEAWCNLENVYEGKGLSRRLSLLRTLFGIKLDSFENMETYLTRVAEIGQQLDDIGAGVEDNFLAIVMLSGLTSDYDPLIMTLENSTVKLTTEFVRSRLTQEHQRRQERNDAGTALSVKKQSKVFRCFRCKKPGHSIKDCPRKAKDDGHSKGKGSNKALLSALTVELSSNVWYVDSGATSHMCNNKNILHNFVCDTPVAVSVANGEKLMSSGRGNVKIPLQNTLRTVSEVLYVPMLATNLLSVSAMTRKGFNVTFQGNSCKIYDGKEVVASARCQNGIYILNTKGEASFVTEERPCTVSVCQGEGFVSSTERVAEVAVPASQAAPRESQEVWHKRLGHLNVRSMQLLKGMSTGMDFDNSTFKPCVVCIQGKQTKLPFPKKSKSRAKASLGLVHSDLCGPFSKNSFSGSRYFLTFIDDFTRKTYVYFLKSKNQVFDKFKEFKAMVENQTGNKIKVFRTDNGGEYVNKCLQDFLKSCGIRHQTTVPHSPQQNGVAERANRTIVEKARCMLLDAGLDQRYWAEAVNTAVYLKNRIPTKAVLGTTPEEKWSNKKVNITHLRTFGCLAYALIGKRKKFDSKCKKYIFVGYCEETKGYRLINPSHPSECIKARNVTFLENEFYSSRGESDDFTELVLTYSHNQNSSSTSHEIEGDICNETVTDQSPEQSRPDQSLLDSNDATGIPSNAGSDESSLRPRDSIISVSSYESDDSRDETYIPGDTSLDTSTEYSEAVNLASQSKHLFRTRCFDDEPETVLEALQGTESKKWRDAMSDEYKSFLDNKCWTMTDLPEGQRPVKCKWVYKRKKGLNGEVLRFKARLVAKGYTQKYGVNYNETFSPVVRYSTIRMLLALAAEMNMEIDHLDVKTAFLNGDLKETIYMEQPEGFEDKKNPGKVYRLNKAIYGLKQASKSWYEKINTVLIERLNFRKFSSEPCVFMKNHDGTMIIIALYVDDIILFSNNKQEKFKIKENLMTQFEMKDLGPAHHVLGMKLCRKDGKLTLDQSSYIQRVLERFQMSDCRPACTPMESGLKLVKADCEENNFPYRELVGCLMYIAVCTRPDIAHAVSILSQFNDCHTELHWKAAKRVLRYLKGTVNNCLTYEKGSMAVSAYVDADWAANEIDRRSFTGFVFKIGKSTVSWESRKQKTVALSSTEAEYMALSDACKEALFIRTFLYECLGIDCKISMYNDSQSAQKLCVNPMYHARTKHIDVRHHFIRGIVNKGIIELHYLSTDQMTADILTKPLNKEKTVKFVSRLGITEVN